MSNLIYLSNNRQAERMQSQFHENREINSRRGCRRGTWCHSRREDTIGTSFESRGSSQNVISFHFEHGNAAIEGLRWNVYNDGNARMRSEWNFKLVCMQIRIWVFCDHIFLLLCSSFDAFFSCFYSHILFRSLFVLF